MQVDTLIHARWVIPVEPHGSCLSNHSIAITAGRITAVLPTSEARDQITATQVIERPAHALIPGLINAHTHSPMSLMRGLADDMPLMTWLSDHIWPVEAKWVSENFVADGSRLSAAEMLSGGTTCFNDMYFFPDVTARVCTAAGIRCSVGMIVIDFPSVWASDAEEYLSKGLALHDEYRNEQLVTTAFAPHAPYSVSRDVLSRVHTLAAEMDVPVHMHIHETADEVNGHIDKHGMRPLEDLQQTGLLSPELMAVHMTQLTDEEIQIIADAGSHIVHCPESNMKLASGMPRVADWLATGINVALGTDGAASNNDQDMFSEMRSAAMLAKAVSGDASALPAEMALRMATLNGAIALGQADNIGSLEVGKAADIAAVSLDALRCQPIYNPISQLVYTCSADQVSDTWVAGRQIYADGHLTTLDENELRDTATNWRDQISDRTD